MVDAARVLRANLTQASAVSVSPASLDIGQHVATGGVLNIMGYSNPQVDDLVTKASTTLDANQASSLVKQLQALVLKDMPYFGLHRLYQAGIYGPTVRGFPIVADGTKPLEGSFENWNSVNRHTAVLWLDQ